MQMTLQELSPESFQKLTATASAFHVRLSALLETDEASRIQEELSFLKSCGWLKSESLVYFSQKTLRDSSITRGGRTFGIIISTMDELGYDVEWQVLNSKDFGVPQNRERVFIIGHLRGTGSRKVFPIRDGSKEVDDLQRQETGTITTRTGANNSVGTYIVESEQQAQAVSGVYTQDSERFHKAPLKGLSRCLKANKHDAGVVIPVLTPDRAEKRQNGRRFKEDGDPMFTLTGQDRHGVAIYQKPRGNNKGGLHDIAPTLSSSSWQENNSLISGCRIRKLTPKECFRLQGFSDEYFERARAVNSDSQLYKQAGNSVTVNVIYEIARRLT